MFGTSLCLTASFVLLLSLQIRSVIPTTSQPDLDAIHQVHGIEASTPPTQNGTLAEDLAAADELGMPSIRPNGTAKEGAFVNTGPGILSRLAYPLMVFGKYKVKTLRELFLLPFRILAVPVKVGRVVLDAREAIRHPFNATKWSQINSDLEKLNLSTPTGNPS